MFSLSTTLSPVGDLGLSPGGLRVPAQVKLVLQYFVSGFVAELEIIETAQSLGERTQSLLEVLQIGVSAGDSAKISSRG